MKKQFRTDTNPLEKITEILSTYLDTNQYEIFLFGSRARGGYTTTSDYDIGIKWKQPLGVLQLARLKGKFDDTPYHVDLVDFTNLSDTFSHIALQHTKKI